MKLLLVTPPYHAGVVESAGRWVPLNLVYVAGSARAAGFEVEILDAMTKGLDQEQIAAEIAARAPDVVGVTAVTCSVSAALGVLASAKRFSPRIVTLLGGIHGTYSSREVLEAPGSPVDVVVRGEAERTVAELLRALEAGQPLDALPKAWDLLDWRDYRYFVLPGSRLGAVDTSRGCDKGCTFCSQQKFWGKRWRGRSPQSVVADIVEQKERHGVSVVLLTDDYPTLDRARWEELLDRLIELDLGVKLLMETRAADIVRDEAILPKYRRAGVVHVYVGTEATDQKTLDRMKKELSVDVSRRALALLRENDILSETSMILGFPEETKESVARTLALAEEYDPDFCHFLAITPWPYADIAEELAPFVEVRDFARYNLVDPVLRPTAMTLEEVDAAIVDCYRQFYMNKLTRLASEKSDFRLRYLLTAFDLMMRSSFLRTKMGGLGEMPARVRQLLGELARSRPGVLRQAAAALK